MDKRARRINLLQNLAILLLSLSAIVLLLQTPLFVGLFRSDTSAGTSHETLPTAENAALSVPLRMLLRGGYAAGGYDALTTADPVYQSVAPLLYEAVATAQAAETISSADFFAALKTPGITFDFLTILPAEKLSELLSLHDSAFPAARWLLLCRGAEDTAVLYAYAGEAAVYRFATALDGSVLDDALSSQSYNDASFAVSAGDAYRSLHPLTFLPDRADLTRSRLTAAVSLPDTESLLRLTGFNPHTENSYTDASGTLFVRESSAALTVRPDGAVAYQGNAAAEGSIFSVSAAQNPTLAQQEAIAAAQRLAASLLNGRLGIGTLYFSAIEAEANRWQIHFDVQCNGTPVRFADGSHAVSVTVEEQSITAFSAVFRAYEQAEAVDTLLPPLQAAAIAGRFDLPELSVVYADSGHNVVSPCWVAD